MSTTVIAVTIMTAFVSGVVGLVFWKLQKSLDKIEAEQAEQRKEQNAMRAAEREVLLCVADTTILTAKKVNDANSVNGELEKSIRKLEAKKKRVEELIKEIAYERLEGR